MPPIQGGNEESNETHKFFCIPRHVISPIHITLSISTFVAGLVRDCVKGIIHGAISCAVGCAISNAFAHTVSKSGAIHGFK